MNVIDNIASKCQTILKKNKRKLGRIVYSRIIKKYYIYKFGKAHNIPDRSLIYIDPRDIEYFLLSSKLTRDFRRFNKSNIPEHNLEKGTYSPYLFTDIVLDGDWDIYKKPYIFDNIYRGISEYFFDDKKDGEIEYIQSLKIREKVKKESDYAEKMIEKRKTLYESIKKDGYETQYQSGKKDRSDPPYKRPSEVCINIGRNGELIFNNSDAHHRLALAKLLEINEIPVVVVVRHRQWEEIRKEIMNSNSFEQLSEKAKKNINHPDVRYLLNKNTIDTQIN